MMESLVELGQCLCDPGSLGCEAHSEAHAEAETLLMQAVGMGSTRFGGLR